MEITTATQGGVSKFPQEMVSSSDGIKTKEVENRLDSNQNPTQENKALSKENRVLPKEDAKKVVDGLNQILSSSHIKFVYHDKLREYYVTIVDNDTNKIVKEIPPKKMLDIVAGVLERVGIIVDHKI